MAEAYAIGVKIAMSGNVTSFLNTMAQALTGVHLKAKDLEGSLNRAKLALGGMASVAAGVGLARFLMNTTDKAKELSHQLVQIKKLGIDANQFAQVKAGAMSATKVVQGVTQVDALKAYGASYSIFGHDDALKMIPAITRFEQVLGNTTGDYAKASENVYSLIRAGELMGQFVDHVTHKVDVTRLEGFLDFASRAALATHGKVGPETWLGMAQQGGPALSGMSQEGLMTMVAVAQAMGGHRAGTALMSASQQFLGGTTTQRTAQAAHKYGLVGDYDVRRGGAVVFRDGALNTDFIRALRDDPLQAMKIAQSALAAKGLTNVEQQVPELYKIFGRQTTQRMFHDLLRNMPQIEAERTRLKGAMSIADSDKTANQEDYSKVLHNLSAAWKDFNATIGQSEIAIRIMTTLTDAFRSLTSWAQENQGAVSLIGQGLAAVAAGLTVMGGVAVVAAFAAFAPAGAIAAGITGLVAAVTTLAALNWDAVKNGFQSIVNALNSFIEWIAALPGKIAAAIGGVPKGPALPGVAPPERLMPGGDPTLGLPAPDKRSEAGGFNKMAWNAPPRQTNLNATINTHVDGQVVSRTVVSQILRDSEHVRQAPHHDGWSGYVGPDAQFATG